MSHTGKRLCKFRRRYDSFAAVTAIDCSPFEEAYVLVGYADGYVALFNVTSVSGALLEWNICHNALVQVFLECCGLLLEYADPN